MDQKNINAFMLHTLYFKVFYVFKMQQQLSN